MALDGPREGTASGGPAKHLIVFLHGYGADGNDLIGLAAPLAGVFPDIAFASPNAPEPCADSPMGRQWFPIWDRTTEQRLAGARAAAAGLNAFLDAELARHDLGDDRLLLVGFSQGTMMGLHVGLRRAAPPLGIVGFSGRLLSPDLLASEMTSPPPPVCLVHGEADPVVPFESMAEAEAGLRAAGVSVETHGVPGLPHGIDQTGLTAAARFIAGLTGMPLG